MACYGLRIRVPSFAFLTECRILLNGRCTHVFIVKYMFLGL
jgi:hypothetical protein